MGVFEGVNFYTAEKLVNDASQLKNVLVSGGGQREFYPSELVSHVICDSLPPSSLGLSRCRGSLMLHSDWVHMSSRCGVMLPTAPFSLSREKLFSSLIFCPSKLPHGDVEKLACLVFYYGGCMQQRLDAAVTHLITMDTTGAKYACAVRHCVKVVSPDWLIDSINMGKLVDEGDYHPRERGRGDHTHPVQQGNPHEVVDAAQCNGDLSDTTGTIGDQEKSTEVHQEDHETANQTTANYTMTTTDPQMVPIPETVQQPCGAPSELFHTMNDQGKAKEVQDTATSDGGVSLECHKSATSEGVERVASAATDEPEFRDSRAVCTEGGVEEVVSGEGEWEGEGGGDMEIMSGEVRVAESLEEVAVESAVVPGSATSTATASVVSGSAGGSAATASGLLRPATAHRDQTINRPTSAVHNSSEAEHSMAETQCSGGESEQLPRLLAGLVFHLTGYLECMEEDTLTKWKEVIVQAGGSVVDSYDVSQCTHLLALHKKSDTFAKAYADGKCISSAHWLNDILTDGKMFPPRCALHFPTAFKWQIPGADKYSMTLTNYTGSERELVKDMIHLTGVVYTGHLSRDTTYLICKSANGKKYEKAVEWGVTIVNASFLADIIHNGQVPAVLYSRHTQLGLPHEFLPSHCFETSRLLRPWEAFLQRYSEQYRDCLDGETTELVFRSVKRREREGRGRGCVGGEEGGGLAKRQRMEVGVERESPPVVMLTGISQSIAKKLKSVIQRLGGTVTDRPRECTHLLAPRVARTVKFLSGISVCRYVVVPEWVEQCEKEEQLINEQGFTLQDVDAEETFSMDIYTTLSRAGAGKLLQGYCFYATANVQPSHDSLREIIECAGGQLLSAGELQSQFGRKLEKLSSAGVRLLVLSTPEDLAAGLCAPFTTHHIPIYNAELVLTGALKQQLDLSQNILSPAGTTSGPVTAVSQAGTVSRSAPNIPHPKQLT